MRSVVRLVSILLTLSAATAMGGGKHLFILSGQSNMAGMDPAISFTPAVTKVFGKENIIVAKSAYSGASIRSWAKSNHETPPPTRGRVPKVRGHFYETLITGVKDAIKGQSLKSVTFVWMQGESDLNNTAYDAYLRELLGQIQTDIDFKDINIVIGRISDCGLDRPKRLEGKKYIRKTQVEFAEAHPRGAWVDTDDLNDKKKEDGSIVHDLHYTPEGYKILGQRFAEKSIALIKAEAVEELDGAAGKIFDFSLRKKQFRFLKQDVAYDPETGKGAVWHTVRWTDDAVIRHYEAKRNLLGMKEPVIAEFFEIDDENAVALKEGRSFRADRMVLRPDLKKATGVGADGRSVVGWFTPRNENFSRDGVLKLGDKEIPAGAKYGGIRISVQKELPAEALASGAWKVTLSGKTTDGGFVASHLRVEPLEDRLAEDVPGLPRVLSVGDSISMNYEEPARAALQGRANYHRIEDNCWSTVRGMAFMPYWLGDYTHKGCHWDVILFNSGMHDMKQKTLDGGYAVPLDAYKANLRKEISIMKETGATLVFCTTTPVPNTGGSAEYAYRVKGAERDFNQAAREVLRDNPEIQILDLCKVVNESGELDQWRKGQDVHYWKAEEQAVLGKAVADAVIIALDSRK